VARKLADPETRIVSLTITEGGYGVDDGTGEFAPHDEGTLADLRGERPARSVLGMIVEALRQRRERGTDPFTVMSCDNIQGNGDVARVAVTGFAAQRDPELARWIAEEVAFPNSMVDRITPATTDETRSLVAHDFGIDDAWPVRAEAFEQWVLEDTFTLGRPPFERAGVQLVSDVEPYELMKLRLLNASHQAMGYLGILCGAEYVHEVCSDPLFREFLLGYMKNEAIPTLRPVPGIDLDAYCTELLSRFGSEAIRDTLARQVVDGSARIPKFLLPVVRDRLALGASIPRCTLVLAAWSVFLETDEARAPRLAIDARLPHLNRGLEAEAASPGAFLDIASVFGDLGADSRFRDGFIRARDALHEHGPRETMERITRGDAF
jgi:mannitol 2-dehydrogenase